MLAKKVGLLFCLALISPPAVQPKAVLREARSPGIHLIRFDEPPLSRYRGDVPGLRATSAALTGERKLDPRHPASRDYLDYLDRNQTRHLAVIERALGREPAVVFRYRVIANALAVRLKPREAARIARLPGIRSVGPDVHLHLATDAGPAWIGAPAIWDGSATGGLPGTQGEGVVIGILDTGINIGHPSFSDSPADGHVFTNPFGPGNFVGWCDLHPRRFERAWVCNDKLIGVWDFVDAISPENDGPLDGYFHGSHTASIAAGNVLEWPAVSGVAPHANLISYDVCYALTPAQQDCPLSAVAAAVEQAVWDGVDVLNFSIAGGSSPWNDLDTDSIFLNAVAAGILVAASADNTGPTPGTVGHLGPWVATVGASTHHRLANRNFLTDLWRDPPVSELAGDSLTDGYGPAPIVYAGDCAARFPAGTWRGGEIVVCDNQGPVHRVIACQNVADGGARGCVLANIAGGNPWVVAEAHVVPAIQLDESSGDLLRAWLAGASDHKATITPSVLVTDPALGDVMAGFSSRGPNPAFDVVKPDLTAPGVNVLGALSSGLIPGFTGPEFFAVSGTSMASPHVAGAAALLVALHPEWTPPEVKSALMMTAVTAVRKEDGVTAADPFDRGSGRVDLTQAARTGILLAETPEKFAAADPAAGGDPRTLNLPSLTASDCAGRCEWRRTLKSPLAAAVAWTASVTAAEGLRMTVVPERFELSARASPRPFQVTVEIEPDAVLGTWSFGEVVLTPDDPTIPDVHFPVAVVPTAFLP
ncbi:MAG: S8 family serine peptidase [bacterium]|nr:S8 family serine peptidase [bacterium]